MGLDGPAGRSRPAHQERSARRREDVLAAVARLLARGGSVSTITIDEICAEADVSRSSLYLRWSSKDALWADVAARTSTTLRRPWSAPATSSPR